MSLVSYNELKDASKQRLAAAFVNIKDQRSAMAKVDCDKATLDFDPAGNISGVSFKTSISRMKRDYSRLSPSDESRMAACVVNIGETDLKSIMASVDWDKAATDFKPEGMPITGVSFKTSIQRILNPKEKTTGGSAASTTGKKREAPPVAATRSSPSSPSEITPSRKKKAKAKATQALAEEDTAVPTTEEEQVSTGQVPQQLTPSSRESSRYTTPPIKDEHTDDNEESQDDFRYYPDQRRLSFLNLSARLSPEEELTGRFSWLGNALG
ncbi:hypothetical protein MBLNU13_g00686t1 [Cladosporium sp. NU13]